MHNKHRQNRKKRYQQEQALPADYRYRRWFLLGLFALASASLVAAAVARQVLETDFLQKEGKRRHLSVVEMPAYRGVIKDRRGEVLAVSTPVYSVWVNPRVLSPDARTLAPLANVLDLDIDELRATLARYSSRGFLYVKRRVTPVVADRVNELAMQQADNSFGLQREYRRYYPTGEVFAHVIGFTNIDDKGQEGLELIYDDALSGQPGEKYVVRDGRRRAVNDIEQIVAPQNGADLQLSLDARMQYLAYRALKAARKKHSAKAASAVVLDVRTGEILAMVNQPGFNPNGSRNNRNGRLRNRSMTDAYEPGSTMKPFIVAAGLDLRAVSVNSTIDTAPGYFKVGRDIVRDHHNNGVIDLTTLLQKSSNVGASKIALDLPAEDLYRFYARMGFGQDTGSQFPGEAGGQLSDFQRWARIDQATLSFGYGISVTTLQLAQVYAALGNQGVRQPVRLLLQEDKLPGERVMTAATAKAVTHMLEAVVAKDGTAPKAGVPGYRVAGKTGTVKKYSAGGYADDRYRSVFAGVAPVENPRIAVAVMIDEPSAGEFYGGDVAAPVFSQIMEGALRLLNIVPSQPPDLRVALSGGSQ
ncbi:MAG: penicillin-binding protein 2 [Chromatiales bacterium]|jgi:cell division protein FtsI (penicillin-binding protein 3)